jgi:hypothetical protein
LASIKERLGRGGAVVYRVQIRLRGSLPLSATFDTKTAAKHWAQKTETEIRERRYFKTAEGNRRTLADLIDIYSELT